MQVAFRELMFEYETVNHENYIDKCLPAARRLGNKHFGNDWTFQQDGARANTAEFAEMVRRQLPLVHQKVLT